MYVEYIHLHIRIYAINYARMAITYFYFVFVETKCCAVLFARGASDMHYVRHGIEKMYV